jgi:hypothetical protein
VFAWRGLHGGGGRGWGRGARRVCVQAAAPKNRKNEAKHRWERLKHDADLGRSLAQKLAQHAAELQQMGAKQAAELQALQVKHQQALMDTQALGAAWVWEVLGSWPCRTAGPRRDHECARLSASGAARA